MKNLIIPMGGKSNRYPNLRPKWMLTHPKGRFMAIEAISGFNLDYYDKIYFIYLAEHENKYHFKKGFKDELEKEGILDKTELVELSQATKDQTETIYQAINRYSIKGQIVIKDSDNYFEVNNYEGNYVCYADLNKCGFIKPKNKSYIDFDEYSNINNIIEKRVISSKFCAGAYSFQSADLFCEYYDILNKETENFISNIIFQCLLDKHLFKAVEITNYIDWGTVQDWNRYKRSFATLFIDIDGVIFSHASSHFPPYYGETNPILKNLEILKYLNKTQKFQIVLTTSRATKYEDVTKEQLRKYGLKYHSLLMGLNHSKRIIINDYSNSNPYKSCESINLKRNSDELEEVLKDALGIDYEDIT